MTHPRRSSRAPREPTDGVERLLVDGTNLLFALRRGQGSGPAPAAALVGRIRAVIPPTVRIELVFDGPPEPGTRGVRIAHGVQVVRSGRISADEKLDRLVADAIGSGGTADAAQRVADAILVVTDDQGLAARIRRRGARVVRADWLIGRLARTTLSAPVVGRPRPPAPSPLGQGGPGSSDENDERPGWKPGRGATAKRGNPKRAPRARRNP